jgi:hypothetical protein
MGSWSTHRLLIPEIDITITVIKVATLNDQPPLVVAQRCKPELERYLDVSGAKRHQRQSTVETGKIIT